MELLDNIVYWFWLLGLYPIASSIAERPKDWRLYTLLVCMLGMVITSIFIQ